MSKIEIDIQLTKNDKKDETNETCPPCLKKKRKVENERQTNNADDIRWFWR